MNDTIKNEINKILAGFFGEDYLLFIFGSFAAGENDGVSDLDLALYKAGKISPGKIAEIKDELNRKVHTLRELDIVNLTDVVSEELMGNILKKGAIWHRPRNSNALMRDLKRRLVNTEKL